MDRNELYQADGQRDLDRGEQDTFDDNSSQGDDIWSVDNEFNHNANEGNNLRPIDNEPNHNVNQEGNLRLGSNGSNHNVNQRDNFGIVNNPFAPNYGQIEEFGETNWPEGIEPFDFVHLARRWPTHRYPINGARELVSRIINFDTYQSHTRSHGDPWNMNSLPTEQKVHIRAYVLHADAITAACRLSSSLNLYDYRRDNVHIHAMCRMEWMEVLRSLEDKLVEIGNREDHRQLTHQHSLLDVDLYLELRAAVAQYPRIQTLEGAFQRAAVVRSVEVDFFQGDVATVVRWVVLNAVILYKRSVSLEAVDADAWRDRWAGLMDVEDDDQVL